MRKRITPACASIAAAGLALLGAGPASAASSSPSSTVLPLTGYSSIAIDSAHQQVFISGGGTGPVEATDFSGNPVTSLSALDGATSLALSANGGLLYAAITGTDEIAVVNTATLQEAAVYFLGSGVDPRHLAVIGHDIWFSYSSGATGEIGVLDPTTLSVTATAEPAFYGAPLLAASSTAPDTLVAGNGYESPSVVESFDVSSGAPVEIAKSDPWTQSDGCENLQQLAIAQNGADVITACGSPYHGSSLTLAGMTEDATYQTGAYPSAVGVASTGQVAIGIDGSSSSVYLFTPGDSTATSSYQLSGFGVYGLAWNAAGNVLFAISSQSVNSAAPVLTIINVP